MEKSLTKEVTLKKKITVTKEVEVKVKEYNWDLIPVGSKFTAVIEGIKVSGRIQKEDEIYLCQNKKDGADCDNKLGYRYSWRIGDGTAEELEEDGIDVKDFEITLDPDFKYEEPLEVEFEINGYNVKTSGKSVKIGCTTVTLNQVEQIYNMMLYKAANGEK